MPGLERTTKNDGLFTTVTSARLLLNHMPLPKIIYLNRQLSLIHI